MSVVLLLLVLHAQLLGVLRCLQAHAALQLQALPCHAVQCALPPLSDHRQTGPPAPATHRRAQAKMRSPLWLHSGSARQRSPSSMYSVTSIAAGPVRLAPRNCGSGTGRGGAVREQGMLLVVAMAVDEWCKGGLAR